MRKNKKQLNFLSIICLLCIMVVTLTAFSVNLNSSENEAYAATVTNPILNAGETKIVPALNFAYTGSGTPTTSSSSIVFNNGSSYVQGDIAKDKTGESNGLLLAALDSNAVVNIAYSGSIKLLDTNKEVNLTIKFEFYIGNTQYAIVSNNIKLSSANSKTSYVNALIVSNETIKDSLRSAGITSGNISTTTPNIYVKVTIDNQSSNDIEIENSTFNTQILLSGNYIQDSKFSIKRYNALGTDFSEVNTFNSRNVHLKGLDEITINTRVLKSGTTDEFTPPNYYQNIFGNKNTDISWENYYYLGQDINLDSVMTLSSTENRGRTAKFIMNENVGSNVSGVAIKSNFYNIVGYNGEKSSNTESEEIYFNVDFSKQNVPKIGENTELFKALNQSNIFYTANLSAKLDIFYSSTLNIISNETVYALAVPSSETDDNTYILRNLNHKNTQKVAWTDEKGVARTKDYVFPDETGGVAYLFMLVNIDEAGNASSIYSGNINVDANDYRFEIRAKLDNDSLQDITSLDTVKQMFTSYILVGNAYHDSNGTYNGNKSESTAGLINGKIKINQYVTVRIETNNTQALAYLLYNINSGNKINYNREMIEKELNEKKYIAITFQYDSARVANNDIMMKVVCREILTLTVEKDSFDYDRQSTAQYTANDVKVFDRNGEEVKDNVDNNFRLTYAFSYKNVGDVNFSSSPKSIVGNYVVRIEVTSNNERFYGEIEKEFSIIKADPLFRNVRADGVLHYRPKQYYPDIGIYTKGLDLLKIVSDNDINGENTSSLGVKGKFIVENPTPNSDDYFYPKAGDLNVTVRFIPDSAYENSYRSETYTIKVRVENAPVEIIYDESSFKHIYDGNEKVPKFKFIFKLPNIGADAVLELNDLLVKMEYQMLGETEYTTLRPRNAGVYNVRISIDETLNNYKGVFLPQEMSTPLKFVIEKQELKIVLNDETDVYSYGLLELLTAKSYRQDDSLVNGIEYEYAYKYKNGEFSLFSKTMPYEDMDIGEYIIRTQINHNNYKGYIDKVINIVAVNTTTNAMLLNYQLPKITAFDKFGGANIEYLQRLSDIKFDADPYFVRYDYLSRGELSKDIEGRFLFRDDSNITYNPGMHNVNLVFEAGYYKDGKFIRNHNFADFIYPVVINIAKCNVDFLQLNESGSLTLKELIYETKLSETEFLGLVNAYGETVSGTLTIIDDLTKILDVGTHEINCSFIPTNTDNFRINNNFILKLKVTEKHINIELKDVDQNRNINKVYGEVYVDPEVLIDGEENYGIDITFKYYQMIGGKEVLVDMNSSTPIGDYIIKINPTSNNYIGTGNNVYSLTIEEATLIPPQNILLPSGKYGNLLKDIQLSEMEFINSKNPNNSVMGRLEFIKYYDETKGNYVDVTDTLRLNKIGENYAILRFVPFGNDNYEVLEFEGIFNVEKAILTRFEIANLKTTYGVDMLYPEAKVYDSTATLVSGLNFIYTFIDRSNNTPIIGYPKNAGEYALTVTIESPYYEGVNNNATFVIYKALATVEIAEDNKTITYTGSNVDIGYLTKPIEGLKVNIRYRDYLGYELPKEVNSERNRPINVGRYFATITIDDINYEGNIEVEFIIIPRQIEITNLEQNLANIDKLNIISDPSSLNFEIQYRENNTEKVYSVVQPTSAGDYQVKLILRVNGLDYEILALNGEKIVYKITKAQTTVTADSLYVHPYSETAPIIIASVGQTGARYKCLYREQGSTGEFSEQAPINVGNYEVKIVVDDKNYMGETYTLLNITKADLELSVAPYVNNTLYFTNSSDKALFSGGDVRFAATSKQVQGTFKILTDISNKNVGDHQVEIEFIPNDQRNFNSFSNKFITVTINKLDISSVFIFEKSEYKEFYNTKEHFAVAIIADYTILPRDYKVNEIRVKYNNSLTRPKQVGEYQLSAEIEDANVTGYISNAVMSIMAGEPIIISPSLSPINKGDKLSSANFVGNGKGYIVVDGVEKEIPGHFIINEPNREMNFINYHDVSLSFKPNEQNYATITFTTQIFVIGIMFDESDIQLDIADKFITYGDSLSALPLSGSVVKDGITIDGTFSWVNDGHVPNVNERVAFRFTPSDQFINDYNIYDSEIAININKSQLEILSANAVGLVGQQYRDTKFDLVLRNKQDGKIFEVKNAEISIIGDSTFLSKIYSSVGDSVSLNIKINNTNFKELSIDSLSVKIYISTGDNIMVNNSTVAYTGEDITIDELDVHLIDTEIGTNSFQFDKIYYNGNLVDRILNAGNYIVTIKLVNDDNNLIYAGSRDFNISVNKISITDDISLVGKDTFIFGENIELDFNFGKYNVQRDEYSLLFRDLKSGQTSQTPPSDAGEYNVNITFKSTSANFVGSKEFKITINKRDVNIILAEVVVPWRSIGLSEIVRKEINPIFDGVTLGENDYYITFDDKVEPPSNYGIFTVRITINNKNFKGTQSARLRIEQAIVNSETAPAVSSIKFGQAVRNSKIEGGEVRSAEGTIVSGRYAFRNDFADRTDINAGTANVIVVFSPDNANYKQLEISVLLKIDKAVAAIEFTQTNKEYTGKTVYPDFVINPRELSTSDVTINVYQEGAVASSINVGKYSVTITINSNNYSGTATLSDFYIEQANVSNYEMPKASEVTYKSSLANSSLENGVAYYTLDNIIVAGEFSYIKKGLIPSDYTKTGEVYLADVIFVPINKNYKSFELKVPVKVAKANQELIITGKTKYIYGETVVAPTFNIPTGMIKYSNYEVLFEDMVEVRKYSLRAEIVDENYFGYLDFAIEIAHKTIDVSFVNPKTNQPLDTYYTNYNTILEAKAIILDGTVFNDDIKDIQKYFKYVYYARGVDNPTLYNIPPTTIGEYYCRLEFNHPSYKLKESNFIIEYNIERAVVTSMQFDSSSLNRVYGSVSGPIVSTIPTKVSYKVEFTGYASMPQDAGKYTIKAIINDNNYEPREISGEFIIAKKEITIENIVATDKAYDGTSTIKAKGTLEGVLYGDEVGLELKARTVGNKVEAGEHEIELVSYTLTGRAKDNYQVLPPLFTARVRITNKVVMDSQSGSYITAPSGFLNNITFSANEVYVKQNGTNFLSKLFGQKAMAFSLSVKEFGFEKQLDSPVKFYVKIPEEFLNEKNLKFVVINGLSHQTIMPTREGDYYTFYADSSGEVIFEVNNFPYWTIIVGGVILVILLGLMCMYVLNPMKKRKKIPAQVRNEYLKNQAHQKAIMKKMKEEQRPKFKKHK